MDKKDAPDAQKQPLYYVAPQRVAPSSFSIETTEGCLTITGENATEVIALLDNLSDQSRTICKILGIEITEDK